MSKIQSSVYKQLRANSDTFKLPLKFNQQIKKTKTQVTYEHKYP